MKNLDKVILKGTQNFSRVTEIIPYNSEHVAKEYKLKSREASIIKSEDTIDNIDEKYLILSRFEDFLPTRKANSERFFLYKNKNLQENRTNKGIDRIILLNDEEVIGSISLRDTILAGITDKASGLRARSITFENIKIELIGSSTVVVGDRIIKLNRVIEYVRGLDQDYLSTPEVPKELDGISKYPAWSGKDLRKTLYNPGTATVTDNVVFLGHINNKGALNVTGYKLNLKRDITIPLEVDLGIKWNYTFTYIKGQPGVYVWKDNQYFAYPLTGDTFENIISPNVKGRLSFNIYNEGDLNDRVLEDNIDHCAGNYIITGNGPGRKIYDIINRCYLISDIELTDKVETYRVTRTGDIKVTESVDEVYPVRYLGPAPEDITSSSGKVIGVLKSIPIYEEGFIDQRDPNSEIVQIVNKEGHKYVDIKPEQVIGDWLVWSEGDNWVFSTHEQVRKFHKSLNFPYVLNNRVLLHKVNRRTYHLYYPGEESAREVEITNNIFSLNKAFATFRRGILPDNLLDNFEIIGALDGIIWYKQGNVISYL